MHFHKKIDSLLLDTMLTDAYTAPRKRVHWEIHDSGAESPIQRFLNVIIPGSFVAPHYHPEADKWEWFQIIRGKAVILIFDETGYVTDRIELTPNTMCAVEIPPQAWHTIAALEPCALIEIKPGPYTPSSDKVFADWAPRENEPLAESWELWYRSASPGDRFFRNESPK